MNREERKQMISQWYEEYFRDGKLETLPKYVHKDYIQHLHYLPDGRDSINVFMEMCEGRFPTEVKRLVADDELLAIFFECSSPRAKNDESESRKFAVIDIFRMKDGLFYEHWAVGQAVAPAVNGYDMSGDVLTPRTDVTREQENANRELVKRAFTNAFNGDIEGFGRYMSEDPYVEHSPNVPEGIKNLFDAYQKHYDSPKPPRGEVLRMIAEGDLVLAHNLYVYPDNTGDKEILSVDIFRVWDEKFVEHWGVQEPVQPPEMIKNSNGMY